MIGNPFVLGLPTLSALRGIGDQVRHASLISRAGMTEVVRPVHSSNTMLTIALRAIKANLDKPKTAPNGYTLYYQEKYPELRSQCNYP